MDDLIILLLFITITAAVLIHHALNNSPWEKEELKSKTKQDQGTFRNYEVQLQAEQ